MVAGSIQIKGQRFVIVPESEYDRLRELTRELAEGDGPPLPKPDPHGHVPATEYARAALARKLIRDRRRAGLTQSDLATRARIPLETLAKIEKGNSTPTTTTFQKIHRACKKLNNKKWNDLYIAPMENTRPTIYLELTKPPPNAIFSFLSFFFYR